MKARFEWVSGTDSYALWLMDWWGEKARYMTHEGRDEWGNDKWLWKEVEDGGLRPEPTLRLPHEAYAAIRECFVTADADKQIAEHRDDAVKVRDRLLAIVEREL